MPDGREPTSGWKTYEVFVRGGDGVHSVTPFSDALATGGTLPTQALTKMRMVEELGFGEARLSLKDRFGHRLIVRKDDLIWLLKCKPSCWRLYFHVWEQGDDKRIIYDYAVCKKTDKEDSQDAVYARNTADAIGPGGSAITPFEFPVN